MTETARRSDSCSWWRSATLIGGSGIALFTAACSGSSTARPHPAIETPAAAVPIFECNGVIVTPSHRSHPHRLPGRTIAVSVDTVAANGATYQGVKYDFGDGQAASPKPNSFSEHYYPVVGNYTLQATAEFKLNRAIVEAACLPDAIEVTPAGVIVKPE